MRIGRVLGAVTLSRSHASFTGASLRLVVPLTLDELRGAEATGEELVVWDPHNAGTGSLVAFTEGGEAAQPFRPQQKPVDAYAAAVLDHVEIR